MENASPANRELPVASRTARYARTPHGHLGPAEESGDHDLTPGPVQALDAFLDGTVEGGLQNILHRPVTVADLPAVCLAHADAFRLS
jgi:hypothetical protein